MIFRATLLISTVLLASCGAADARQDSSLPEVTACFLTGEQTYPVTLEVAEEPEQRRKGLMGRQALAADAGMLFKYPELRAADQGFWMFQTLIPLDIAYLDQDGVIVSIRQMRPCASPRSSNCPVYQAGQRYLMAVEMNSGYFRDKSIGTGDRLVWSSDGACNA